MSIHYITWTENLVSVRLISSLCDSCQWCKLEVLSSTACTDCGGTSPKPQPKCLASSEGSLWRGSFLSANPIKTQTSTNSPVCELPPWATELHCVIWPVYGVTRCPDTISDHCFLRHRERTEVYSDSVLLPPILTTDQMWVHPPLKIVPNRCSLILFDKIRVYMYTWAGVFVSSENREALSIERQTNTVVVLVFLGIVDNKKTIG